MMSNPQTSGWKKLVEGYPWFSGEGRYPIPAYSEFMPAPRVGCNLYGDVDHTLFAEEDPFGWRVPEIEEEHDLRPALEQVARQVLGYLVKFGRGEQENRIVGHNRRLLEGNHYWSPDLDARLGPFVRERYVTLLPVALAKTQDYLGRVRWTLFGNSEQGPEKAFWQSFRTSPDQEIQASEALKFTSDLMSKVYHESARTEGELRQLGFWGATAGGIAGLVLGGFVFMVLTILLSMIAAALVIVMAREGLAGREPDLASGWAGVQQRLGPVVVASVLVAAIVAALAAMSFGVLGAVAGFFLLYTLPAAALDGHGGPEALRRSVALVKDNLGVTVGLVVGFILVAVAAMLVSTVLHLVPFLGGLAAAVVHGVLVAYLTVVGVRVYLTLPRR